ncbi:CHAT domain-containing protein [Streptomyces sp. NRRL F-2580]|uniref:CHAT domain-containing protein n=1 Tax=Streptomyces sp. NRRL F-2580 TaxID=1463841 RepID=UPI00055BE321|nr:CHAT domain-containing protein [Streptomyces sp. NRRL F-2580]
MSSTAAARIADLLEDVPTASNPPGRLPAPAPATEEPPGADGPVLVVTVVWGDLAQVPADLHVTGHYQSVAPAAAELALDRAISVGPRRTITEHTKLGWLGAQLGEVTYFPCKGGGPVRSAAVVGMGPMGTLTERRAHQMYASLLGEAVALGHVGTMATVLVGSGTGNLTVNQAARALVGGFAGVLAATGPAKPTPTPTLTQPTPAPAPAAAKPTPAQPTSTPTPTQPTSAPVPGLTEVFVVEVDRLRAEQLHLALTRAAAKLPRLRIGPELREESGGRLFAPSAAVYALTALTALARSEESAAHDGDPHGTDPTDREEVLRTVLAGFAPDIRREIREQLAHLAEVERTDLSLTVGRALDDPEGSGSGSGSVPVRMSVQSGVGGLRWAALTGRATVPERLVPVDMDLLRELVERLTEPTVEDASELPDLLSRFVVPPDFQRLVTDDATVLLELDRDTASVPWEFLAGTERAGGEKRDPLAIRTQLSRQLRTPYSRVMAEGLSDGPLRALVIGDPGDPEKGFQLPGARTEALAVATRLKNLGAKVTLFVGAANSTRQPGIDPARRLDVLRVLLCGGNHIVHYCGHSDFDPTGTGRRTGWVFADGLLTAQELALLERPPRIVVANACYTARLGSATGPGTRGAPPGVADQSPWGNPQAALVPSLADEFLRMGVGHYIGAAWRIPDDQGVSFAEEFYTHLFTGGSGEAPPTVGDAVRAARKRLYDQRAVGQRPPDTAPNGQRWSAWAAYQHYGDATDPFVRPAPSDRPGGS